jgi:hypothetical protein
MRNLTKFVAGMSVLFVAHKGAAQSVFQYQDNAGLGTVIDVQVPAGANPATGFFTGTGTIVSVSFPVIGWSTGLQGNRPVAPYTYTLADMTGGSLSATWFPGATSPFTQSPGLEVNLSFTDARDGAGFNLSVADDGFGAETKFYATSPANYSPNQYGPATLDYTFQTVPSAVPEPSVAVLLMVGCAAIPGYRFAKKAAKRTADAPGK